MACKCCPGIKLDMLWLVRLLAWGCIVFYFTNKYFAKKEAELETKAQTQAEKKI